MLMSYLNNLWLLALEAAPWLLLGLIIAGLLKALIPQRWLEKHLGGDGIWPMTKAAILGAPLPLCSCGVIPAALALRRSGASKSSTVSFLVSTPETGVDSVSITYALLGPVMAVARPIAAVISALLAGFLVMREEQNRGVDLPLAQPSTSCCSDPAPSCCASEPKESADCCASDGDKDMETSCCSSETQTSCCSGQSEHSESASTLSKIKDGIDYTFRQLFNDILLWLVAGLLFAAAVQTFVPETFLAQWGSGLLAMIVMILIGVPMYVCATASTPIAAGLMLAGISPGTALVFLMAGPATNIGSLGIIGKELGKQAVAAYLAGVSVTAIATGMTLDAVVKHYGIDVQAQLSHAHELLPVWLSFGCLMILVAAAVIPRVKR